MQHRIRICSVFLKAAAACLVVCLLVTGCRKGEDDPLLSLRSRKARLAGTWKLKRCQVQGIYTNPGPEHHNYIMTAEDGTFHWDYIGDSVATPFTGNFTMRLVFDKKGGWNIDESFDLQSFEAKGTWDFLSGTGEARNKERILITATDVYQGTTLAYHPFMTVRRSVEFHIKELRKNYLVLVDNGAGFVDSPGTSFHLKAEYVFSR